MYFSRESTGPGLGALDGLDLLHGGPRVDTSGRALRRRYCRPTRRAVGLVGAMIILAAGP
jgi:hypothetical protein